MDNDIDKELLKSLNLFQDAINETDNLNILGVEKHNDGDCLVIQNQDVSPEVEGHQVTVETAEIFAKIRNTRDAEGFIGVITNTRKPIVCEGITRIVGYYSRTHNWNKSKNGELRDRQGKNYALSGKAPEHEKERLAAINGLS